MRKVKVIDNGQTYPTHTAGQKYKFWDYNFIPPNGAIGHVIESNISLAVVRFNKEDMLESKISHPAFFLNMLNKNKNMYIDVIIGKKGLEEITDLDIYLTDKDLMIDL
jgi:hypothetical protein